MTDDSKKRIELSRRTVLGSVGAMGAAGAMGGAGTMAFFNDPENFEGNVFRAGKMDLRVDWQEEYNGEKIDALPDTDDDGVQDSMDEHKFVSLPEGLDSKHRTERYRGEPLIDLRDVKPGDSGEVTISLHVFGNDALVWLNGRLRYASENGTPEPERKDPDEVDGVVELLDEIRVTVWRDEDCDNRLDDGEHVILDDVTLRRALAILQRGYPKSVLLDGKPDNGNGGDDGMPVFHPGTCPETAYDSILQTGDSYTVDGETRTVPMNPMCERDFGLTQALKLDPSEPDAEPLPGPGNTEVYTTPYGDVRVTQTGQTITWETDSSPDGSFDAGEDGFCVSKVIVKGGNEGANVYNYDDDSTLSSGDDSALQTPTGQDISHVDFCVRLEEQPPNGGDGRDCFEASHNECVALKWELPVDHANEIMTDRVAFDLGFVAEQCRHNDPDGAR